ncbi:MAG: ubiquinol-cytochrome c reductase iron-sulfur subunit [Campylobacterales bacterium]|nr:ubiquinol-cytochrome c reductase iron-sulfur subunit [Campylobacterales bacterium]
MKNSSRRGFMGKAFGAVAGVGAVAALYAMKKTWDPLPSVKAAGFTTLDMSAYKENELVTEKWRGKPIFVLKYTPEMMSQLTEKQKGRTISVGGSDYMVTLGLCTHLGCIPSYNADEKGFLCACHGGTYDFTGDVTKLPPPRGLDIPPFKIEGNTLVLGEVGPEYSQMKETGITL